MFPLDPNITILVQQGFDGVGNVRAAFLTNCKVVIYWSMCTLSKQGSSREGVIITVWPL